MIGRSAAAGSVERISTVRVLLLTIWVTTACAVSETPQGLLVATQRVSMGTVDSPMLTEASGLAASRKNAQVLWTHNDSGDSNQVYAIDTGGRLLGRFEVPGCPRGDWEDIAIGPGPDAGVDYLYIGNIGDNRGRKTERAVCRVPEPSVDAPTPVPDAQSLDGASVMRFRYADGPRDAETLMVDPRDGALFIVSKRDPAAGVYGARWPGAGDISLVLDRIAELPVSYAVAGDISADGRHLLVKTYTHVLLWSREHDQQWTDVLKRKPLSLVYVPELGGEAIAWAADGSGFYTLAERILGIPSTLWFYGLERVAVPGVDLDARTP